MERKMFAVKRDIGQQFFERCRKKNYVVARVLESLMRLFNSGVMDSVINSDEEEEKESEKD